MNNQERNRDALIEHIAEQDRIIRRRNEQIANQAQNAREDQQAIEELDARNKSLVADLGAAAIRADKAESRLLAADDITAGMIDRARKAWNRSAAIGSDLWRDVLTAALTPPRPEGAEKVEAVLHQYWSGDIDGDDLADRIAEEMNR